MHHYINLLLNNCYMDTLCFFCLSVDGHLGYFHCLTIMKNAVVNLPSTSFCVDTPHFSEVYHRLELLVHVVTLCIAL